MIFSQYQLIYLIFFSRWKLHQLNNPTLKYKIFFSELILKFSMIFIRFFEFLDEYTIERSSNWPILMILLQVQIILAIIMRIKVSILVFVYLCTISLTADGEFNTTAINKHGKSFTEASCNKDTVIDFSFSSSTLLKCTSSIPCTSANNAQTTLRYLDVTGSELTYTLMSAQATDQQFVTGFANSFVFKFAAGSKTLFLAIPFTSVSVTDPQALVLSKMTNSGDFSQLYNLKDAKLNSDGLVLSAFNYLNNPNYGKFYEVMITSSPTTLLISKVRLILSNVITNLKTSSYIYTTSTLDYVGTGDVLCWGSASYGMFQTHMRQSIPLWFFCMSLLLYWLYNLISNEITPQVYQRSFQNNKWTCWSLYSIYNLSHQQFFTKTSRTAVFFINVLWQAMVVSGVYSVNGESSDTVIIIWAAVIAYAASLPVPYIFGNLFLKKIYKTEIRKLEVQIEMKLNQDRNRHDDLQTEVDHCQERLYGLYYAFYSIVILLMIIFGILSVHVMQQTTRDYYHLHFYWLASVGIAMGLDHLLIDPILTAILGNTSFYRSRGYYYDSKLSEFAKQLD